MKKIIILSLALASVLGMGACKKSNSGPANQARVMFMNGCINATTLTATANSGTVGGASGLAFLSNSGYQNVTAGSSVNLSYIFANTSVPLVNATESLNTGSYYSVFAAGQVTAAGILFTSDDLSAPASGNAKMRFVNLSPDSSLHLNVYVGGTQIAAAQPANSATSFVQFPAADTTVLIQDNTVATELKIVPAQNYGAGKIYTVVLTGVSSGTGSAALTATVINNN